MNVGDEHEIYLTTAYVREAFEYLEEEFQKLKAAIDEMNRSTFVDLFKELQEACENCVYYESSADVYGKNLRIHKNDIYKVRSKPQKVQRVYRRWHNDYSYRFA
jgi:mRNA-degrading endonuclease RelE of RelBE toxin-antitoxin system